MQILLVIVFRIVELGSGFYLGGDRPESPRRQLFLVEISRCLGQSALVVGVGVDARPVLGSLVVALAHALGRIVALPEQRQQVAVRDATRLVDDPHHLGVPGRSAAHLQIRRVLRVTSRVADLRQEHTCLRRLGNKNTIQ